MVRINFQTHTIPQLEQIVKARLAAAPADTPGVLAPDTVKFAAMKMSISGNAWRVLDIFRRHLSPRCGEQRGRGM